MAGFYDSLKLYALKSVIKPDKDASLRRIFRWYSKEFSTPLYEVEDLPVDYVLCSYFESRYEEMSEEERQKELEELLETEVQRKNRLQKEDEEDFQMAIFAEENLKKDKAKKIADLQINKPEPMRIAGEPESNLLDRKAVISDTTLPKILPDITFDFAGVDEKEDFDVDSLAIAGKE